MVICTSVIFILLQNYYYLKDRHDDYFTSGNIASHFEISFADEDDGGLYYSDQLNKTPMYYVGQDLLKTMESDPRIMLYGLTYSNFLPEDYVDGVNMTPYAIEGVNEILIEQYHFSKNTQDAFELKCDSGRFFQEEDFNVDTDDPVPVVLGYNLQEVFKIGDTIHLKNEYYDDRAVVIGFLEKYSSINAWETVNYMDDAIVVPGDFPRDFEELEKNKERKLGLSSDEEFTSITSPCIYVMDETMDLQKYVNSLTAKNGFYTLCVQATDGVEVTETKSISEKNVMLIAVVTAVTGIICLITLGMVLYNRALEDLSTNCIYLLCGIPLWKINTSIILEMLIWAALSCIPACMISQLEYKKLMVSPVLLFAFSAIVALIALIPTLRVMKKVNLDVFVRNRIIV
jgi:hypothetical protein